MVSKREKLRRELFRVREQVFWKAHDTLTEDAVNIDENDVQWIREACGKNFSSDGSLPPSMPSIESSFESVSSSSAPTCSSEKTTTEELRVEPSDCSEDNNKGGYDSSDSEDSPRIKTRRRVRGVGRPRKQVVNRIKSENSDNQHGTSVNKSSGAKDGLHSAMTEDDEQKGEMAPRRSLRFHKVSMSSEEDHTDFKDNTSEQNRVDSLNDNSIGLNKPRTRGQTTSESTSDDTEIESVRTDETPPSPSRTLRSCKKVRQECNAKHRADSTGDVDITPTRRTRSSLSQSENEVKSESKLENTDAFTSLHVADVNKEEKVLKEIRGRGGRNRPLSQSEGDEDTLPGKRAKLEVKRRPKGRRKSNVEPDNSQVRITQFFMKRSPRQKRGIKSPKAKFLNGYKSPKSAKSTESESSKSDEENSEHRVERLSSLRSFNLCKDNLPPQSPCPKCQIQHKRSLSRSPERKNKELRACNMQSPKSRSRLLPSLRCSPSRNCSSTMSQVASVV